MTVVHGHYMLANGREWKVDTSRMTLDVSLGFVRLFKPHYKEITSDRDRELGIYRFEDDDGNLLLVWEDESGDDETSRHT